MPMSGRWPDHRPGNRQVESGMSDRTFVFPRWVNYLLPLAILGGLGAGPYALVMWTYGASADTLNAGYMPDQPVPYSHEVHVGQLGMDCRYCHTTVDKAAFAAIPPTQTCIACHAPGNEVDAAAMDFARDESGAPVGRDDALSGVWQDSENLVPVWASYETGDPIDWVKVHDLPDYAYFDHSAHVNKGVSCVSCHGRVDKMETVYQAKNLSMGWCLECHREPEKHLRPVEHVYDLAWSPTSDEDAIKAGYDDPDNPRHVEQAQLLVGKRQRDLMDIHSVTFMTACSTCHR